MNYNETVEKVMMLLKEKEVCSSSQKSHKDCYESLGLFIKQRDGNYSEVIRESWLAEIKNELPRQRYAVWVQYAYQLEALMTYLEDGHCSLSNNLSENAIRPFTVGRKNWLFSASPKGAAASSIVYTMVEMAKANDLNTYKYLTYPLSQRPNDKMSDEQLEQLAP